jgi:Nuclear transport factor 2 (NTF2) domain
MHIQDLRETVIDDYFTRLNQSDFAGVAELFADLGCLYPPFDRKICGREAIHRYLQAEAIGIEALPQSVSLAADRDGETIYHISGQVKTSLFTVNIGWTIELNADQQIGCVTIKLLAELQELLGLDRSRLATH